MDEDLDLRDLVHKELRRQRIGRKLGALPFYLLAILIAIGFVALLIH